MAVVAVVAVVDVTGVVCIVSVIAVIAVVSVNSVIAVVVVLRRVVRCLLNNQEGGALLLWPFTLLLLLLEVRVSA